MERLRAHVGEELRLHVLGISLRLIGIGPRFNLAHRELRYQGTRHLLRDGVLRPEDVAVIRREVARPEVCAGGAVKQPDGDCGLIADAMDLSAYQRLDGEFAACRGRIRMRTQDGPDGGGRTNLQLGHAIEFRSYGVGKSQAQVLILFPIAVGVEGQNGERMDATRRAGVAGCATLQAMRVKNHGQDNGQAGYGNRNEPCPGGHPDGRRNRGTGGRGNRWGLRICLRRQQPSGGGSRPFRFRHGGGTRR